MESELAELVKFIFLIALGYVIGRHSRRYEDEQ